jgi:outer membrane protein insertion porin family
MVNGKRFAQGLLIPFLFLVLGLTAWAQEQNPSVAIMPFAIRGIQEQAKIQKSIEELLARQLTAEGARVVSLEEVAKVARAGESVQTEEQARLFGRRLQADYVLIGSFNQIGNAISLDSKLVSTSGQKKTEIVFAEERGMENLAAATNVVVQRMAVHLLAKAVIEEVQVRGTDRIESDAIKLNIKSKKGEVLRPEQVAEDIKSIYKMGFFEKVDAEITDTPAGKVLAFVVQENPTIQEVHTTGNKKLKEKDIMAAISTRPFSVLQRSVISEDVQKIIKLYHQKGYFNVEVKSSVDFPRDPRKAVVTFAIKENSKVYIKKIGFVGNKNFSARKLRSIMETKEEMIVISWFTDRGILQRDILDTDLDRLSIFYHDKGFMDAKVGTPQISLKENAFYIEIPVEEGERYRVSDVEITGDLLDKNDRLVKALESKPKEFFGREKVRNDMDRISKTYMDQGYAYTQVDPIIKRDEKDRTTSIDFDVKKKGLVHIGRVTVTGNTKTLDKVIRRELKLAEGDLFSSTRLEQSITNLKKLDYFEDVEITPTDTEQTDIMNLNVKVKEKLTGAISFGGGYSSEDGLFTSAEISQRNLFGKGQYASIKGYLGQNAQRYVASFTEPYMFDRPISGGIDLYNWLRQYPDFTEDSTGFRLRSGYRFGNYSRIGLFYTFSDALVTQITAGSPPPIITQQEGRMVTSALTLGLERDSTDHPFLPTRGMLTTASVQWGSPYLGGQTNFLKAEIHHGIFFPLFWKLVGYVRGEFGYINILGTDDNTSIPLYDRFFLGGINSLRGFKWATVGPTEGGYIIGGTTYGLGTVELLFPLIESIGMRGVFFFDAGNSYLTMSQFSINGFRTDAGAGIRWKSPLGPLRIEWGYNLDPQPGESKYQFQFSAGAFF